MSGHSERSLTLLLLGASAAAITTAIVWNVLRQLLFPDPRRPPVVFHWIPQFGSTANYGQDPYAFFFKCREKYGDCFTFDLLGMHVTTYLGPKGNNFILNGKHQDLNAEEVYGPLTIPIFGRGVIYDIPNSRLMEQKRLAKDGFSTANMRAYIPLFVHEVELYVKTNNVFKGKSGIIDISSVMDEISLFTAAGSLQGKEVREAFDSSFATHYRHLDDGFAPINFMFPGLPIPVNRRRDRAQRTMAKFYMDIITRRRATGNQSGEHDMLWSLMEGRYKDGSKMPDPELANLMLALLMGGE
jgi:sterol 14alpha-demethylase